jgi:LysM repeat protein
MQTAPTQLSVRLSVLLTTVCVVSILIGGAAEAEGPPAPSVDYVVRTGDTLWAIAATNAGAGQDIRDVVAAIAELNQIEGSVIHPGQVLRIPGG